MVAVNGGIHEPIITQGEAGAQARSTQVVAYFERLTLARYNDPRKHTKSSRFSVISRIAFLSAFSISFAPLRETMSSKNEFRAKAQSEAEGAKGD